MTYYNVRVKSKFANWGRGDQSRSREHIYVVAAPNPKVAGRRTLDKLYGNKRIADMFVDKIEVWLASAEDILEAQGVAR